VRRLQRLPAGVRDEGAPVFTAHSIPLSMAKGPLYREQLQTSAQLIAGKAGIPGMALVYQSRAGVRRNPGSSRMSASTCDASMHQGCAPPSSARWGLSRSIEVVRPDREAAEGLRGTRQPLARAERSTTIRLFST